jgi:hypothetical protein
MSTLHPLIVLLIHLTMSQTEDVSITTLSSQILPFHLGKGKIIESKHTFIHYVELNPLIKLLDNTVTYYKTINNTLNNQTTSSSKHSEQSSNSCSLSNKGIRKYT